MVSQAGQVAFVNRFKNCNVGPPARKIWSFKAGGLSRQWSLSRVTQNSDCLLPKM